MDVDPRPARRLGGSWNFVVVVGLALALLAVPAVPAAGDHAPPAESYDPGGSGSLEGTELVADQEGLPCFRVTRSVFGLRGDGTYEGRTASGGQVVYRGQIGQGETLFGNGSLQVQIENTEDYYHGPFGTHGTHPGGQGCSPSTVGAPIPAAFRIFAAEGTVDIDGDKDVDELTGAAWVYRDQDGVKVPCTGLGSFARGTNENPTFGDPRWVAEWTLAEDCVVVGNEAGTPGTGEAPRGTFHTHHGDHDPCFGDVTAGDCPRNIRVDHAQFLPKPGPFLALSGPTTAVVGCDRSVAVTARFTVDGFAQPDVPVTFSVTGPAPTVPPSGAGVTGADGRASFSFTAASAGDYTVAASATYAGQQAVANHTIRFERLPPLSISSTGRTHGQTEEATTVTATVRDACGPLQGALVDFSTAWPAQDTPWTGQATPSSGQLTTDINGQAAFSFSGDRAGAYTVTASTSLGIEEASASHTTRLLINTLKRLGATALNAGERPLLAAMDPAGAYAYFATGSGDLTARQLVKVDLTSFQRVGVLDPPVGQFNVDSMVIDPGGDYAYVGTWPGQVNKLDLRTFQWVDGIEVRDQRGDSSSHYLRTAVIDPGGDYAYFGDDGYFYEYGDPSVNYPARVLKIDLNTFELVGALHLELQEENFLGTTLMDPDGTHAYFTIHGDGAAPAGVVKVDLTTFQRVGTVTLGDENKLASAVIDPIGDFAYFGTNTSPGRIVKVNLTTLQRVGAIILDTKIVPFGPLHTRDHSERSLYTAVMDPAGEYAYFGTHGTFGDPPVPARLIKIDLDTFERAGSMDFPAAAENQPRAAVVDPTGNHAYFGAKTPDGAGTIVKVALRRSPSAALSADADTYATDYETPLTVPAPGVLDGDTDTDGDPLVAGQASDPAGGSVTLNPNGSFTYTPDARFAGTDTFTYTTSDGMNYSAPATVSVAVAPPKGLTGRAFGYHSFDMFLFGGAQPDIGPTPSVTLAPDGSNSPQTATAATGTVAYGPATLFSSNQIDVATSGRLGGSVTSSVTINDINTSRVEILGEDNYDCCDANGQSYATPTPRPLTDLSATCTASGTGRSASTTIANGWLYLDSGWSDGDAIYPEAAADAGGLAEHDPVKVALPTNPAPGTTHAGHIHLAADSTDDYTVVLNEQIANPDGSLTVNAVHQYLGTKSPDVLTGELVIGQATCGVPAGTGTNAAPDAVDDAYVTTEDTPTAVMAPGVVGNDVDPDGDALTASLASGPAHGTLALNGDGSFTYAPNANYNGPDSFTYTVADNNGGSDTATVALTVNPANDAPVATNDAYATAKRTTLTVAAPGVLGNDADPDGDALSAASPTAPANGKVSLNANGSFTYTPNRNFAGTDTFTYTASDNKGGTATARVSITVGDTAPPPPPSGPDLSVTMSDSPDPATVGTNITYTIDVANAGPGTASGVSVAFSPTGTTYVSGSGGTCTVGKGKQSGVRCELGEVAAGATRTLTVVVKAPTKAGTVSASATVSSTTSDPNTSNNTATASTSVTKA